MVYINEFLPNPSGVDNKENEWIEIYNDGNSAINLNGFKITSQNKSYIIKNKIIQPKEFLILKRSETGLLLNNSNGILKFFDKNNNLIQEISFFGSAPEGKSFSKFGNNFVFTNPTPTKENFLSNQVLINDYFSSKKFNFLENSSVIFAGLFFSLLLTLIIWFIFKNYGKTKELFFK